MTFVGRLVLEDESAKKEDLFWYIKLNTQLKKIFLNGFYLFNKSSLQLIKYLPKIFRDFQSGSSDHKIYYTVKKLIKNIQLVFNYLQF